MMPTLQLLKPNLLYSTLPISSLVSYLPEKSDPFLHFFFIFNAWRRAAIYHSHYTPPLLCFSYYQLKRVCCCTEYACNFLNFLQPVHYIYGKRIFQYNNKHVTCSSKFCYFYCFCNAAFIRPIVSYQPVAARLVESNSELYTRIGCRDCFIHIFDSLYEVRLSYYHIVAFWLNFYNLQLEAHGKAAIAKGI